VTRRTPIVTLAIGALCAAVGGCGGVEPERVSAALDRPAPTAGAKPSVADGMLGRPASVPAQANIFGAGRDEPPEPGGGGPGVAPPRWDLPAGSQRVVTFPSATGRVNPIVGNPDVNGAAGDRVGPTDVTSYGGISGIVHRRNGMFLVGVFLTDEPPAKRSPPRLNFTKRERSGSLAPRIGQTFLVGDGKKRSYDVPSRATRLYLGFADAYLYVGDPGWYDNNAGELSVTVKMTSG
jgi:hypothetical protein